MCFFKKGLKRLTRWEKYNFDIVNKHIVKFNERPRVTEHEIIWHSLGSLISLSASIPTVLTGYCFHYGMSDSHNLNLMSTHSIINGVQRRSLYECWTWDRLACPEQSAWLPRLANLCTTVWMIPIIWSSCWIVRPPNFLKLRLTDLLFLKRWFPWGGRM